MELIPYTLAENAGLSPVTIVTGARCTPADAACPNGALLTCPHMPELRRRHAEGDKSAGINVKRGAISDMVEENVVQPLLVTTSAISLATECVRMILKIDDVVRASRAAPLLLRSGTHCCEQVLVR